MNYFIRQSWLFFFTVTSSFHVSATTTLRLAYSDIESYPFRWAMVSLLPILLV